MIYGHTNTLERLSANLPPVSLLVGPESVGKWAVANEVRKRHGIRGTDFFHCGVLSAERARELVQFLALAPTEQQKLAIVRLDKASPQALNAILKALEELASHSHVILISAHPERVPDTIRSRAEVYQFGYLSPEDLKSVLITAEHVHPTEAEHLSRAGGAVQSAVIAPEDTQAKGLVLRALSAISGHDAGTLDGLSSKWDDHCTEVLRIWCGEALSERWRLFIPEESIPMSTSSKLRILLSLKPDIRPKLVVRSSLMTLLTQGV